MPALAATALDDNQFLSRVLRGQQGFTGSTNPVLAGGEPGAFGGGGPGGAPGGAAPGGAAPSAAAPSAAPSGSPGAFGGGAPGSSVGGGFGPGLSNDPGAFEAEASFGPSGGPEPSSISQGVMDTLSGLGMIAGGPAAALGFGINAIANPNQRGFPGMFNTALGAMSGGMGGTGFAAPGVTGMEPDFGGGFGPAGGGFGSFGDTGEFGGTEGFSDFGGMDFSDIDAAESA